MTILDKKSIKYFIDIICIQDKSKLPYLPQEIREIIWDKFFTVSYISCNICNEVILDLNININYPINSENFLMYNGNINCINCKYMDEIFI